MGKVRSLNGRRTERTVLYAVPFHFNFPVPACFSGSACYVCVKRAVYSMLTRVSAHTYTTYVLYVYTCGGIYAASIIVFFCACVAAENDFEGYTQGPARQTSKLLIYNIIRD